MNNRGRGWLALFCTVLSTICLGSEDEFAPGEILVKFRGSQAARGQNGRLANEAIRARPIESIARLNVSRIRLAEGMRLDDALAYYNSLPSVEYAEGNPLRYQTYVPNDPKHGNQYALQKVKCPEAWDLSKGASNVIIAVIDDGIAASHEDLNSKRVTGFDFSDGDTNPATSADHGTHVAGITAAATDNGKGIAGAGFNCRIMPLRIFPGGAGARSAQAIIYAADNGARVINMSYGGYPQSTTERNAVNYAWNKGVILVAAAGNQGQSAPFYPAAYPNVIAVASTGRTDSRSAFSNYGESWVDVAAPGEDIESTVNGGYANDTGTSMSSPLVSGIVALLWSLAPSGTSASQIRAALENNTDPVSNGGVAFGRVNAYKALLAVNPGPPQTSAPVGVMTWLGTAQGGDLSSILVSDTSFYRVQTVVSPPGHVAGATIDFSGLGSPSNLREGMLYVEANGPVGASCQVFLWEFTRGAFVSVRSFALRPTGTKRDRIVLPSDLTKFVSNGNLKVGLRAVGPNRPFQGSPTGAFELKVGFLELSTRSIP